VLIEQSKAPFGNALPEGKVVEYGEIIEQAVRPEMQEEVGLKLLDLSFLESEIIIHP
jgi:8-oxo-dGTP diphosphatase